MQLLCQAWVVLLGRAADTLYVDPQVYWIFIAFKVPSYCCKLYVM